MGCHGGSGAIDLRRDNRAFVQDDRAFVKIVDAAFADAARRSGSWLLCRPGCTQCCVGAFAIDQLDAARLQRGLKALQRENPERAARVGQRARTYWERVSAQFPGDLRTGLLFEDTASKKQFEEFANDEPCPALDPVSGTCDLYASRPLTCRVFGPPLRAEEGLGVCDLCFRGATPETVAACELHLETDNMESELNGLAEAETGQQGQTIVGFCLASPPV